jgi:hypothetical protein
MQAGGGIITAGTLTGLSTSSVALTGPNQIANLAAFTTSGAFTLDNNAALTQIAGTTLNAGSGDILIDNGGAAFTQSGAITTTSGDGAAVTIQNTSALLVNDITTGATGTVTLGVAGKTVGATTQTGGGVIMTGALTGLSTSSVSLTGPNQIANLAAFTTSGPLTLDNDAALTQIAGTTLNAGAGDILIDNGGAAFTQAGTITTTSNDTTAVTIQNTAALSVNDITTGATGTVTLGIAGKTVGATTQTGGGIITAGTLTGTSTSSVVLTGPNQIANLAAFTTSGAFTLDNTVALTQTAATTLNAGAGDILIDNGGAAFTQAGTITTTGNDATAVTIQNNAALSVNDITTGATGTVTLGVAGKTVGATTQTAGGVIMTGTLTGLSASSVALTGPNQIATLGAFTTSGAFTLDNTVALTQTAATTLNAGAGDILIDNGGAGFTQAGTITTTSNDTTAVTIQNTAALSVNDITTGAAGTVTLGVTGKTVGTTTQVTGGVITAGTLTGSVQGSTLLGGMNQVGNLGPFTADGSLLFNDTQSATLGSLVSASGMTITDTAALTISGPITSGGSASFTAGGALTAAGAVTASGGDIVFQAPLGTVTLMSALNAANYILIGGGSVLQPAGSGLTFKSQLTVIDVIPGDKYTPGAVPPPRTTTYSTNLAEFVRTFATETEVGKSIPTGRPQITLGNLTNAAPLILLGDDAVISNSGQLYVGKLAVIASGGSANLFGVINNVSGQAAPSNLQNAQAYLVTGGVPSTSSNNYKFNACSIGSPTCVVVPILVPIQPSLINTFDFISRAPYDDIDIERLDTGQEDVY